MTATDLRRKFVWLIKEAREASNEGCGLQAAFMLGMALEADRELDRAERVEALFASLGH